MKSFFKQEKKVTLDENKNAKACALLRGYLTRKLYNIQPLKKSEQTDFKTLILGNDPELNNLEKYQANAKQGKPVIIATSGFRSIQIACQIGNNLHNKMIPQVIILDNSEFVGQFWKKFILFVMSDKTKNEKSFLEHLQTWIDENQSLINTKILNERQKETQDFFTNLFHMYGFDYVRAIITGVKVIIGSWADPQIFKKIVKLTNYLETKNIYSYSSNIFCVTIDTREASMLLENIVTLNPRISIHSDIDIKNAGPQNMYIFENHTPDHVISTLFPRIPKPETEQFITIENQCFGLFDPAKKDLITTALKELGNKIKDKLVQLNQIYPETTHLPDTHHSLSEKHASFPVLKNQVLHNSSKG